MTILSGFAHQYGKTPAVVIGLISAIVVGTWGLFLSVKEPAQYNRIRQEIERMNQLAKKLNILWTEVVNHIKKIESTLYNSEENLKKAYNDQLEKARKLIITPKDTTVWTLQDLSDILGFLMKKSTSRIQQLRTPEEDEPAPVDEAVLQAFENLLRACQRVVHGYVVQDKPILDHPYVQLSLKGTKATVEKHPDKFLV